MSWIGTLITNLHNWRFGVDKIAAATEKTASPLRIGVLGAAEINGSAIFNPCSTHPDAVIAGVAARSKVRAEQQIAQHRLKAKAYGSYDELLADPEIEAVYIPSPNGLHFEHTISSLKAGKHVLVEKPIASNAQQVREIRKLSEGSGKLVLEAFHWRFHPAAHQVKALIESGKYGDVKEVFAQLALPAGSFPKNDIRFNYNLAGGSCMDFVYCFSATANLGSKDLLNAEVDILEAKPRLYHGDNRIDEAMTCTYALREGEKTTICRTWGDFAIPWLFNIIPPLWRAGANASIELEKATIWFPNYVSPYIGCDIVVTDKATGSKSTLQQYKDGPQWGTRGERWWSTYRYQLEAFVDRVRALQGSKSLSEVYAMEGPWVSLEESEKIMGIIDQVYETAGMPLRQ